MAEGLYSAGAVGVDIKPVTDKFFAELNAKLARLKSEEIEIPVNLDPDDALAKSTLREWQNRDADVEIKFHADDSQIRNLVKQWDGKKQITADYVIDSRKTLGELDRIQRELTKTNAKADMYKAWGRNLKGVTQYDDAVRKSGELTRKQTSLLKDEIGKRIDVLRGMQDTLYKTNPLGSGSLLDMKAANAQVSNLRKLMDMVDKDPARVRVELAKEDYAKTMGNLEAIIRKKAKVAEENNRVRLYLDGAERIEARLSKLEHTRLSIPAEIKLEQESLANRLRMAAEKVRLDPDAKYEVELDIAMKSAEEKIKRFREKNDKLDMDVDLETAAARAHLAYFTRPRTIDIFARFKGTDMGKILNGMTSGSTGLKGVENSFSNLVNLFDTLDKKVPRVALVGTILSDIGAGAINVAGTVGGLGKSIVSLSKAAYAMPAALGAAAAGFYGLYSAVKTASANFDKSGTIFDGLQSKVGKAFWDEAKASILNMSGALGDDFVANLAKVSAEEGKVAAGMADIVSQADEGQRINAMLTYSRDAVTNLNPGLQALVQSITRLGKSGGQYLPQFTQWVSENMSWFAAWADEMERDSSKMESAIMGVKEQSGYLGSSIGSLKGILSGVFGTLAQNQNGIQKFSEELAKADRAVHTVAFQDTLNAWVTGAHNAQLGMRDSFKAIGTSANEMRSDVSEVFSNFGTLTGNVVANISKLASGTSGGIRDFSANVRDGFTTMTSALAQASPMFSSLISMAGQLTKTFGGTFANTLKAVSPTIQAIASVTNTLSQAFSKLPASVQGMLGLWVTFGRAGRSAWTALKTGALENIQSTMRYQNTMRQLGVTVDGTKIKITQLVAAMAQLERNSKLASATGNSMAYGNMAGLFTGSVASMNQMASASEKAATSVAKTGTQARLAAEGAVLLGTNTVTAAKGLGGVSSSVQPATSALGKLKTFATNAGTTMLGMFGGPAGIALTAGLAVAGTAFSAYQQHVSNAQSRVEGFNEAAKATPMSLSAQAKSLDELQNRLDNFGTKVKENLESSRDGWDKFWNGGTDIDKTSDAVKKLGLNTDEVSKIVAGSSKEYDNLLDSLQKTQNSSSNPHWLSEEQSAASVLSGKLKEYRKEQIKTLQTIADGQGKRSDYVQSLLDEGEDLSSVSAGLLTASEQSERLTSVKSKLASLVSDEQSANIRATAAASSYYKTLDQVRSSLENVNELHEQGQQVWDATAKNFDFTTEAGRTASDALTSLASSSNDYLTAMIAQGKSTSEVIAKQKELSANFDDAARTAGVAEDAVSGLNSSLLMTPKEIEVQVSAQTLQAQQNLADVVESMAFLFPDKGRKATKELLLQSIWSGKTDATQLQNIVRQLSDKKHQVAFTADGTPVVLTVDELEKKAHQLSDGTWQMNLTVNDQASQVFDSVNLKASALEDGKTVQIKGDNTDLMNKIAQATGATIDTKTGMLTLNSDQYMVALALANGATIDTKTGKLVCDNSEFWQKFAETQGWTIDTKTGYIIGNNGQALASINEVNSSSVGDKNFSVNANGASAAVGELSLLQRMQIADKSFTITANYTSTGEHVQLGTLTKADGGRIYGPGTGTSDSIPAWVSNGEAVLRASSLKKLDAKYGKGFFDYLNTHGDLPEKYRSRMAGAGKVAGSAYRQRSMRYATGGRVQALKDSWDIVVNPNVTLGANAGTTVNQTFNTKIVRSSQDLYEAAPILHRNALAEARRYR
ncbi:hypothetical protein [Bifidobacterium panos]|uniref:Uncharacterized protein n=1 Tax=Bifidobacterium panos TaxID=2675321 RepID=A0ABX1T1R4_9BIFI|nr:hypothetical protein [Bifidobacterium sp. DSM 109963]NMN02789.1 hypothetical protein [Bifidobacterium sp. DSM 109963]